jgi:L-ascorbate metabolism protein UlaG (beta-lactamase superfamily)
MKNLLLVMLMILAVNSGMASNKSEMKSVEIQLIRNATLKLKYNGTTFLVDPVLAPKHSFMSFVVPNKNLNPTVDQPLSTKAIMNDVNAILVTHAHADHFFFDEAAKSIVNPSLPLFAQAFDKEKIEKGPFNNITYIKERGEFKGTSIIRTGGKHGPEHLLEGLGEVSGFILQAENYPTIYIVGDCLWDDEIKSNIKKYNPDIIITNSGGAQWGGDTILMDENSTTALAKFAPGAKVMAVHMEALDHCKTTRKLMAEKAKEEKVKIIIPQDGEIVKL